MSQPEVAEIASEYTDDFYRYWRIQDRSGVLADRSGGWFSRLAQRIYETASFISRVDRWFLSNYIQGEDANRSGLAFLRDQYIENGAGLFGRQDRATLDAFRRAVGSQV